jgi:hypothetical protein
MTPEERNLVAELFDRLATLEDAPRDRDAERVIQDGLRQAPNALYALVQTVLVQDEALKRADARIKEFEAQYGNGAEPPHQGGFLDTMRDSLFGRRDTPRAGSVPTVRPGGTSASGAPVGAPANPAWSDRGDSQPSMGATSMGQPPMGQPYGGQPYGGSGGSFLGTAAATAVGVIGSSLMLDSIRSMMGHRGGAHAAANPPSGGLSSGGSATPWGGSTEGSSGGGGNLARQAGIDDISRGSGGRDDAGRSYGIADNDGARGSGEGRNAAEDDDRHHPGQDDRFVADDNDDDDDIDLDDGDDGGDFDDDDDQ